MKNKKILQLLATTLVVSTAMGVLASCGAGDGADGSSSSVADSSSSSVQMLATSPKELFTAGKGIALSNNGEVPEWSQQGLQLNEYYWGGAKVMQVNKGDLPLSRTHGVLVKSNSETSKVEYNNVINIDGFTKNDTLIEFLPVSSFRVSSADYEGMRIWITDAEDESNWVCINMYAIGAQYDGPTRMEALTSTGIHGAYRWGEYHYRPETPSIFYEGARADFYNTIKVALVDTDGDGKGDTERYNYFTGNDDDIRYSMLYEPMTISYDTEDKAIWVSGATHDSKVCLLDLDDTGYQLINDLNKFNGFASNRVKVSLQTYGISGESANYVITNVANEPMYGETLRDSAAPEMKEGVPVGGVPVANVGKAYPVWNMEFYDLFDGIVDYTAWVKWEDDATFTKVEGDSFTPAKSGTYTLRYEAVDRAGNKAVKEYPVQAKYGVEPIYIEMQSGLPTSYNVGEWVKLPAATATGGSGPLSVEVEVVRLSDGAKIANDKKQFQPVIAGEYVAIYTATDYVGNQASAHASFTITTTKKAVYESELVMYKRFFDNVPVILPEVAIYDYDSVVGQRLNATTTVTVQSKSNPSVKKTVENYVFKPTVAEFGDKVIVEYTSVLKNLPNEAPLVKSFEVDLLQAKYSGDYLALESNATLEYSPSTSRSKYVTISPIQTGDVTVSYANPVRAKGLKLSFDADEGMDAFDCLQLELIDFIQSSKRVAVKIIKDTDGALYVDYNGTRRKMTGTYGGAKIALTFDDNKLYDDVNAVVADFVDFDGFVSDTVWMRLTMVNAKKATQEGETTAQLKLTNFGQFTFTASYKNGVLNTYKDQAGPTIVLQDVMANSAIRGESFVLAPAKAFDSCSPYVETFVKVEYLVEKADGTQEKVPVMENVKADNYNTFVCDKYGKYAITYSAADANNNPKSAIYYVTVRDLTAPIISYNGKAEYNCSVGETLTFENVSVTDEVDETPVSLIMVISPSGINKFMDSSMSFTFTEKGKYIVRYVAYDDNFNYAFINVYVYVK